jgi:hypothetical protein
VKVTLVDALFHIYAGVKYHVAVLLVLASAKS